MPHWEKTSESIRLVCIPQLLPFFGLALQRAMPHLVPVLCHQGLGTSWNVTHNHPSPRAAHRPLGSNNLREGEENRREEKEMYCSLWTHPKHNSIKKLNFSDLFTSGMSGFTVRHWQAQPQGGLAGTEDRHPSQTSLHVKSYCSARNYPLQLQVAGADPETYSTAAGQSTGAAVMSKVMNSRDMPMKKTWGRVTSQLHSSHLAIRCPMSCSDRGYLRTTYSGPGSTAGSQLLVEK